MPIKKVMIALKVTISLNYSKTFLVGMKSIHPEILIRAIKIRT